MRDQSLPKHFAGNFASFGRRFHNVHAAFESILECPLPATSGVDLRFHDDVDLPDLARDRFRFVRGRRNFSGCRGDAKFLKQLFRLILVDVHRVVGAMD